VSDPQAADEPSAADPVDGSGRLLFRYVVGDEWIEHRAVMAVFADTFFSEFTPDDVRARLEASGHPLDLATVASRLESLRGWGNLAVSSSVGNPSSLADYYRRRNRYLITRAGQEVHQVVEGVLTRVDEVRDVSTGRLRALLDGLVALAAVDPRTAAPTELADLVRAVFDPHRTFTTEITQFFAAINQWQTRYDLSEDEFSFFAEVLVGYVAERLDEVERMARPIAVALLRLQPALPIVVERAHQGLASRVADAGLEASISVSQAAGGRLDDWDHLSSWFLGGGSRPSRIARLTQEAVAAIRTLTLNLTRLSRVGVAATSRRGDFLRLAQLFERSDADGAARIAAAALGLTPTTHWGVRAADADDPEPTSTSWWQAPRAEVPISLRERGDTSNRGQPSPLPDRSQARWLLEDRRATDLRARHLVDEELLGADLEGRVLSRAALARLQEVVGRTLHQIGTRVTGHRRDDGAIRCHIERTPGRDTALASIEGTLTLLDLRVRLERVDVVDSIRPAGPASPGSGGPQRDG